MNKEDKISKPVELALKNIREKEQSEKQLMTIFKNINTYKDITEYEREILNENVEKKLRTEHPRSAKKIFGSKDSKAEELLGEILLDVTKEYDWSDNDVGSHVKVGGSMINGTDHVCRYISYKNKLGICAGFAYKQTKVDSEPLLEVELRQVRTKENQAKIIDKKNYSVQSLEEAYLHYKNYFTSSHLSISEKE
tara:strand:- start:251 stop:832 length:582 start_codon:yes stop_codon:yes gene_type:complete